MRGSNTLKNILTTTALAATLIFVNSGSAKADENNAWSGMTIVDGQASLDYSAPQITTITQSSLRAIGEASNLDILENQTVNILQGSKNSLFVARATGAKTDPTRILGKLSARTYIKDPANAGGAITPNQKADGNVMVIDRNGVFFGKNSIINVGSIIASTGDLSNADIMDGDGRFEFSNFGDGKIENQGTITVADAGLAAFVSPFISNSGTINAKLGKVAFASGSKVTLDLYGDGLVEIAADDKLSDALIDNTGKINAEGGNVVITANAAKAAVDTIINMDGVVDVSSVSVKGGKIILSGGNQGKVAVKGKLNASGVKGGTVKINGQKTEFTGSIAATGDEGFVDVSGHDLTLGGDIAISEGGSVTFDPVTFTIGAAEAATIVSSLAGGGTTNVLAQETITLNNLIDSSVQGNNAILNFGDEGGAAGLTVNLNKPITLAAFQTLKGDATTVNVSNFGRIQNGVDVAKAGATVNVSAGQYNEDVVVKTDDITLLGANAGIDPNTGVRGAESVIKFTGFAGVRVKEADGVTVDGFTIRRASGDGDGVWLDRASNSTVSNNILTKVGHGVLAKHGFGNTIRNNAISLTAHDGIKSFRDNGLEISNNVIANVGGDGMELAFGDGILVSGNTISNTNDDGVDVENSSNVEIAGNTISNVRENGMELEHSAGILVDGNTITNSPEDGIYANDIFGAVLGDYGFSTGHALEIVNNTITTTGDDGIEVVNGGAVLISGNTIAHAGYGSGGGYGGADKNGADGIYVSNTHFDGGDFEVESFAFGEDYSDYAVEILGNSITETGDDGIEVLESGRTLISDNEITDAGRDFEYAYDDYYCYAYGECGGSNDGDGIHVENVFAYGGRDAKVFGGYGDDGYSVQILDNLIDTTGDDGIEVLRSGKTLIAGNDITNAGLMSYGYPELSAFVSAFEGDYPEESDEEWNPDADGIHVANVYTPNIYSYGEGEEYSYIRPYSVEIIGNDITNVGDDGIEVLGSENTDYNYFTDCSECGYYYNKTGRTLIQDNDVSNTGLANGSFYPTLESFDGWYGDNGSHGITVENIYGDYGYDGYSVEIVGNTVDNAFNSGIRIEDVDTSLILNNAVSNSGDNGFLSAAGWEYWSYYNANGDVVLAGNSFTNNPVGARFESGEWIDLTGATNTINGGEVGLQFEPYDDYGYGFAETSFYSYTPSMNLVNDTIGTTVFNGQSTFYVELRDGAFFAPGFPTVLDGTDATFDGVHPIETGNVLTQGQYDTIEAMIHDFLDEDNRGLFFFGLAGNNLDIGQEDIFRTVDPFAPQFGNLNVTILGLPNTGAGGGGQGGGTGGGLNLANIEPAAGGEEEGNGALPNIEPAAGGEGGTGGGQGQNAACWGDAVNGVQSSGQPTTIDFSTDPSETLQDVVACGGESQPL